MRDGEVQGVDQLCDGGEDRPSSPNSLSPASLSRRLMVFLGIRTRSFPYAPPPLTNTFKIPPLVAFGETRQRTQEKKYQKYPVLTAADRA